MTNRVPSYFDKVYSDVIVPHFESIGDDRDGNQSYSQVDALKSGFSIYSLKSPSLLSFQKRSTVEDNNLNKVYGIGKIPSDNGLRKILDNVDPKEVRQGFNKTFKYLKKEKILTGFKSWQNHLVLSIDGVEHFCSKKVSCPKCMSRNHRDGTTSFYHSMLSAALVHPDQKEVVVLDNEPIVNQDGMVKNDCERNAAKRLLSNLKSLYSSELMILVFDALYACNPIVTRLEEVKNWKYVIGIKEKGNKHLFQQFDKKNEKHNANWHIVKNKEGKHEFGYINNLELNESSSKTKVNMLFYEWTNKKGEVQIFTWITNVKLSKNNVFNIMKVGRSRWKIENETFNTLKNQGYNFSHNFGHGENNLCTIFAYLMMMAFNVDQIQQHCCRYFQTLLKNLKTKAKLWESLRAVFKILPKKNMTEMFFSIAEMYQIRLI
jgi:hypothetical protein